MKKPVDPDIYRARQERDGDIVQFLASLVGLLVIAAIFFGVFWFAWGNTDAMFAVGVIGVICSFVPATVCVLGIAESVSSIIDTRKYISRKLNEKAWNAQQEELKRLQNIIDEEGL